MAIVFLTQSSSTSSLQYVNSKVHSYLIFYFLNTESSKILNTKIDMEISYSPEFYKLNYLFSMQA